LERGYKAADFNQRASSGQADPNKNQAKILGTAVWDDLSPRRLRFVRVAIHLCSAVVAFFERKKGTAWELQKIYFPPDSPPGLCANRILCPSRAPRAEGSLVRP
jgi:hypothetical protein